jgi:hypothetical protein
MPAMSIKSAWTEGLDAVLLFDLLKYVGEFGAFASLIQLETGEYPLPHMQPDDIDDRRKYSALIGIAMGYSGDDTFSPFSAESETPAFSEEYRYLLTSDKRTVWATDLTESGYTSLILDIGEFCTRAIPLKNNPRAIPRFPRHLKFEAHLRTALGHIVRIFETCLNRQSD